MNKLVVQHAAARPIGAQIDAATARLTRAIKAEEVLKELWVADADQSEQTGKDRRIKQSRN